MAEMRVCCDRHRHDIEDWNARHWKWETDQQIADSEHLKRYEAWRRTPQGRARRRVVVGRWIGFSLSAAVAFVGTIVMPIGWAQGSSLLTIGAVLLVIGLFAAFGTAVSCAFTAGGGYQERATQHQHPGPHPEDCAAVAAVARAAARAESARREHAEWNSPEAYRHRNNMYGTYMNQQAQAKTQQQRAK